MLYRLTFISFLLSCLAGAWPLYATTQYSSDALHSSLHIAPNTQAYKLDHDMVYQLSDDDFAYIKQRPLKTWQSPASIPLDLGANRSAWVRVALQTPRGDSATKWVVELAWPNLTQVSLYLTDSNNQLLMESHAPLPDNRRAFPLELPADRAVTLYVKVSSAEKVIIPLLLKRQSLYQHEAYLNSTFTGLFYGIILAMLAYNFSLYVFIRDSNYGYYCVYVVSIIAYTLTTSSSHINLAWHEQTWLSEHAYRLSVSLAFLSAAVFIRTFLSLSQHKGSVLWLSNIAIGTWCLLLLTTVWFPAELQIVLIDLSGLASCIIGLWIAAYLWYLGNPSAKYMTIAWTPLVLSTFVLTLGVIGVIPFSMDLFYIQNAAFTWEVLLLSMALVERINRMRREHADAQAQSLYYEQKSLVARNRELAAQKYALDLEHKAKAELEKKVTEQTSELQSAMYSLTLANTELERISKTDSLTNLYNRRYFDQNLTQQFRQSIQDQSLITVMMLDIDYFKNINDQYGHQAGDKCLKEVAAVLRQHTQSEQGLCARYGGEEFCIALMNVTLTDALNMANMIRKQVEELTFIQFEQVFHISISIGLYSGVPAKNEQPEAFLKQADDGLYQAKRNGRNQVVLHR